MYEVIHELMYELIYELISDARVDECDADGLMVNAGAGPMLS
jgi:hypothetical protein